MEILSPAGSYESLTMALNSGADAVYLGLEDFSARKNAANFTHQELEQAVKLCKVSGVKVYAALNTLIGDDEFEQVRTAIKIIANLKVDAVIVQDLAVARFVKELAPNVRLHASTQMSVSSVSGAKLLSAEGFSRVVLARELNREEIAGIVKSVPEIEAEVFVHGALCVSVSGQCLMSAVFGGERSANRGLCAQPCRLNFTEQGREYVISLKDLSIIRYIPELAALGVVSAKIEGRMKRPEYVAAVTDACVKAKNGEPYNEETLSAVFARGGSFTQSYWNGTLRNMQGCRTKEDVVAAGKVLAEIKNNFAKPFKRRKIDFTLSVTGEKIFCTGSCNGKTAEVSLPPPETALTKGTSAETAKEQLSKLGGTVFTAGDIKAEIESGLFVSAKTFNGIRREIVKKLEKKLINT